MRGAERAGVCRLLSTVSASSAILPAAAPIYNNDAPASKVSKW
jgi:hypothetical protein